MNISSNMDTDNEREERRRHIVRLKRCRATVCCGSARQGYIFIGF